MEVHIDPNHSDAPATATKRDRGFTLVELLIVIVILGILATVTVFAVRGITDKGKTSACQADLKTLQVATETYFAQYGAGDIAHGLLAANSLYTGYAGAAAVASPDTAWAAGATPADSLLEAGFLRSVPSNYAVLPTGGIVFATTDCGAVGGDAEA